MNLRWLLHPVVITANLILGVLLLWMAVEVTSAQPIALVGTPPDSVSSVKYPSTWPPFSMIDGSATWILDCRSEADCTLMPLVAGGIPKESAQPDDCHYDRAAFDAIRHQSRLARQAGRYDKATILDFSAAILRCQPEELEAELADAMSKVWNKEQPQ